MIVYNIRNNGPWEYDKWILNTFQLCNKVYDEKKIFNAHAVFSQLENLNEIIQELTQCDDSNTLMERLLLIEKARGRK